MGFKHNNTDRKKCVDCKGVLLKNKPHLVKFQDLLPWCAYEFGLQYLGAPMNFSVDTRWSDIFLLVQLLTFFMQSFGQELEQFPFCF